MPTRVVLREPPPDFESEQRRGIEDFDLNAAEGGGGGAHPLGVDTDLDDRNVGSHGPPTRRWKRMLDPTSHRWRRRERRQNSSDGVPGSPTSAGTDNRHLSRTDISASPRLVGYMYMVTSGVVCALSAMQFERIGVPGVETRPEPFSSRKNPRRRLLDLDARSGGGEGEESAYHARELDNIDVAPWLEVAVGRSLQENETDASTALTNSTTNTPTLSPNVTGMPSLVQSETPSEMETGRPSSVPTGEPSSSNKTVSATPSSPPNATLSPSASLSPTSSPSSTRSPTTRGVHAIPPDVPTRSSVPSEVPSSGPTLSAFPSVAPSSAPTSELQKNLMAVTEWKVLLAIALPGGAAFFVFLIILLHFDKVRLFSCCIAGATATRVWPLPIFSRTLSDDSLGYLVDIQRCFPGVWRSIFQDGSNGERYLLFFLFLVWGAILYVCTSANSLGYVQANVFFSSWIGFFSVLLTMGLWRTGAEKPSLMSGIQNHPRKTTYNWVCLCVTSFILFLVIIELRFEGDDGSVTLAGVKMANIDEMRWNAVITMPAATFAVSLVAPLLSHRTTRPGTKKWVQVTWNIVEGILLFVLLGLWAYGMFIFTGVNGVVNGINNAYVGLWMTFLCSLFAFGTWFRQGSGLLD